MLSLLASIAAIPKQLFVEALAYTKITLTFSGSGSVTDTNGDYAYTVSNMRCAMNNFNTTNFVTTNTMWLRYKMNNASFARIISFGRLSNNTASHAFISFSGTNYNNYDINFKINGSTLYNGTFAIGSSANTYNLFYVFTLTSGNVNCKLYIYNSSGNIVFNGMNINYTVTSYNNAPFQEFDFLNENAFGDTPAPNGGILYMGAKFDTALSESEMETYSTQVL